MWKTKSEYGDMKWSETIHRKWARPKEDGEERPTCSCMSTSLKYLEETVIMTFCSLPPRALAWEGQKMKILTTCLEVPVDKIVETEIKNIGNGIIDDIKTM